jgi:hypothetical protein
VRFREEIKLLQGLTFLPSDLKHEFVCFSLQKASNIIYTLYKFILLINYISHPFCSILSTKIIQNFDPMNPIMIHKEQMLRKLTTLAAS